MDQDDEDDVYLQSNQAESPTTTTPEPHNDVTPQTCMLSAQKSPDSSTQLQAAATQSADVLNDDESPSDVAHDTSLRACDDERLQSPRSQPQVKGHNKSSPAVGYRPGRLSYVEILERLFPYQKKAVLELVLQGCSGDVVKAIEHFLSAHDTIIAQQHMMWRHANPGVEQQYQYLPPYMLHPDMMPFHAARQTFAQREQPGKASCETGMKSAFSPLSPNSIGGIHSAFVSRQPQPNNIFLAQAQRDHSKSSGVTTASDVTSALNNTANLPYSFMPAFSGNSSFGSQFLVSPFRPWALPASTELSMKPAAYDLKHPAVDATAPERHTRGTD